MTCADVSRRGFIAGATAFAAATGRALPSGAAPLFRLGMISDVHLNTHETGMGFHNCLGYEPALRYFDSRKADGVLVCGDLSDFGTAVGLRRVAAIWRKVFPGNRRSDGGHVEPLFIYGDHDMGGYMHKLPFAPEHCLVPGELDEIISDGDNAARLWEECFGEKWAPIQLKELCGFTFVLAHHPRHCRESANGDTIPGLREFLARRGVGRDKPFFYVQHRMLRGTVSVPNHHGWDSGAQTEVLSGYRNAIAVTGHGHINAADDLNLWQGAFTAMQVPSINYCVTRYGGKEFGTDPWDPALVIPEAPHRKSWQGMFGTMYADRFVVERRDFLNGLPLAPDWTIPLPKQRPGGVLGAVARAARAVAPQFRKGARITAVERTVRNRAGITKRAVVVSFPVAHATATTPRAFDYLVAALRGGKTIARKKVFSRGLFWADEKDTSPVTCAFALENLPDDWRDGVTFAAVPRDSFGNRGRGIKTRQGISRSDRHA